MKSSKPLLLLIAAICIALLGAALYLQIVEEMQPCPLCIIQRYLFCVIALVCLIFAFLPRGATRIGAGLGVLGAIGGAATAGWHLWVKAHPGVSCGIDPLETSLNHIAPANMFPLMFQADGLCAAPLPPLFGLSIPQWSLIWFVILGLALARVLFKRR
jgi:disulfide bond formation protein DsbB